MFIEVLHHASYERIGDHVWVAKLYPTEELINSVDETVLAECEGFLAFCEEDYLAAFRAAWALVRALGWDVPAENIVVQADNGQHYQVYGRYLEAAREKFLAEIAVNA